MGRWPDWAGSGLKVFTMQSSLRVGALLAVGAFALLGESAHALNIVATYDSSITGLSNSAAVQANINSAVAFYNAKFSNNITVRITFTNQTSGLGGSSSNFTNLSYSSVRTALLGSASSADDASAYAASLPTTSPIGTTGTVDINTANARAIGLLSNSATSDGTIFLNTGICFTNHTAPVSGKYDLYAVVCHEIDEVLGTVSNLDFTTATPCTADFFRYSSNGVRAFNNNTAVHAFFSVNGGASNVVEYNHFNHAPGDWGDWITHNPGQVQDYAGSPGVTIDPGDSEFKLLDVVGYTLAPVPEPTSMVALGLGVVALVRRRRSK